MSSPTASVILSDPHAKLISRSVGDKSLLRQLDPVADSGNDRYRNKCLPGTREKIIGDICTWASTGTEKILWLHGLAGSGKSSIASSAADSLVAEKCDVVSFFCKRDTPELRNWKRIVPTVVYHLASSCGEFRSAFVSEIRDHPTAATPQMTSILEDAVLSALTKVKYLRSASGRSFVVLLEALDEVRDESESVDSKRARSDSRSRSSHLRLLNCVSMISEQVDWLKIIVTSRRYDHIKDWFLDHAGKVCELELTLDDNASIQDIHAYARNRVEHLISKNILNPREASQVDELVEKLCERASGLFQWITTAYSFLRDGLIPEERLKAILVGDTVSGATHQLYELYKTVIDECIVLQSDNCGILQRVLSLIIAVFEPLQPHVLAVFLAENGISCSVLSRIVNSLLSVLVVGKDGRIRISTLR